MPHEDGDSGYAHAGEYTQKLLNWVGTKVVYQKSPVFMRCLEGFKFGGAGRNRTDV